MTILLDPTTRCAMATDFHRLQIEHFAPKGLLVDSPFRNDVFDAPHPDLPAELALRLELHELPWIEFGAIRGISQSEYETI